MVRHVRAAVNRTLNAETASLRRTGDTGPLGGWRW